MADEKGVQLTSYSSPQQAMESRATATTSVTWKTLFQQAARTQYGANITIRDTALSTQQLESLKECITLKIVHRENEPREVGRSIVDITTKDYINNAAINGKDAGAKDTTKASVSKSTGTTAGRNYQFTTNEGLSWGMNASAGLQILAMGMAGGSVQGGAFFNKDKSTSNTTENSLSKSLGFTYNQEEEISVPPGKRVHVKITTYTVSYELRYTLEFSVPKSRTVSVSYITSCLCGLCSNTSIGYVPASTIVRTLPGFREDDLNAYFTQDGALSWIGESCVVEKNEYPIQQMST